MAPKADKQSITSELMSVREAVALAGADGWSLWRRSRLAPP
jgi:hypothetical protein